MMLKKSLIFYILSSIVSILYPRFADKKSQGHFEAFFPVFFFPTRCVLNFARILLPKPRAVVGRSIYQAENTETVGIDSSTDFNLIISKEAYH